MNALDRYAEFREQLRTLIGGRRRLPQVPLPEAAGLVKEKGRKSNYQEFNLLRNRWEERRRDLNLDEYSSFIEVSLRAAACPMPLNADVWDGLRCPFRCAYCFADSFRASLYTSFFDNTKTMGIRHCSRDFLNRELDRLWSYRGRDPHSMRSSIAKALALEIPIRIGIRYEDFIGAERREGIALWLLQKLAEAEYPVMINTKSALVAEDEYLEAMTSNPAGAAIHFTLITSRDDLGRIIEPGAPLVSKRWAAAKRMAAAGIRVVARIEPYMALINDRPEDIRHYIDCMREAGVNNITADTYSYSAGGEGVKKQFESMTGWDFERMFMLTSDSQPLGSYALHLFLNCFREEGFSVSTFDGGNIPDNNQMVCCEVEDWFHNTNFNRGSLVSAVRFIQSRGTQPTSWRHFRKYVMDGGGFLSEGLEHEVQELWNNAGGTAYQIHWTPRIQLAGWDRYGTVWQYNKNDTDYREELWQAISKK
jgi:DNA repair photolyase